MRRTVLMAALAGVVAAAAACGGGGATKHPPRATAPSGRAPDGAENGPITVAFAGDVHFNGRLAARLADPATALGPTIPELKRADLAMVNLETAVTTRGTKAPKQFTFRAPPSAFGALRAAGIDVVTMANNHAMDYGTVGLRDSLAAIKRSGFPTVGIGANIAQAFRPYYVTVKGNRLAILGATQVLDDNLITAWTATAKKGGLASAKNVPRLVAEVRAARRHADTVIVYLHWGQEKNPCPLPRQKTLARALVRAGADVIVGGHAHIPLGGGYMKGRYVDYGLGNYFFTAPGRNDPDSGILEVTLRKRKVLGAEWKPVYITKGVPRLLNGTAATRAHAKWERLRRCTGLAAAP
ncbi:CapA family protein [Actinoallomurus rhizosphaericola]|uniref:CapA family protein n=1 Tax=Actinoallomurus rhizosphaericola TaxID=2952536 RepID=UPI0020922CC2|nr:CapA family protein [Actinoallomurus rhizosphaericola]MCO5994901.1 CapA family protein [Actinoallomurus rhizosphaericola]